MACRNCARPARSALCDLLKSCSVCSSGGEAKHFIAEGNVAVNGV
ncbi:RNA-binding S4 domain-containing protein, partial [Aquitalea magnusonii]